MGRPCLDAPLRQRALEASRSSVLGALDLHGCCLLEGFLSAEKLAAVRKDMLAALKETPKGRNKFEGSQTCRVYAVFAKTREFDDLVTDPFLLGILEDVFGSRHFNLSSPVGIQIGAGERAQDLHRDDGKYPIPRPHAEVVVNMMFALDDFTAENGATLFVPGSHLARSDGWSQKEGSSASSELEQEVARRERKGQDAVLPAKEAASRQRSQDGLRPGVQQATMPAGSLLLYRGSLLHGGGANASTAPRLGVIMEFCAGWLRPQENHVLAVPREVARGLSPRLQELLGYNVVPPFIGYVDGRDPARLLRQSKL